MKKILAFLVSMVCISCYNDTFEWQEGSRVPTQEERKYLIRDTIRTDIDLTGVTSLPFTKDSITVAADSFAVKDNKLMIPANSKVYIINNATTYKFSDGACKFDDEIDRSILIDYQKDKYTYWLANDTYLKGAQATITREYWVSKE